MPGPAILLPFQPSTMSTAQLAAVSYLARYAGLTHALYAYQLAQWFAWCQSNGLDPLVGIQRAHVELYIRQLGERPLMDSSVNTMMRQQLVAADRVSERLAPDRVEYSTDRPDNGRPPFPPPSRRSRYNRDRSVDFTACNRRPPIRGTTYVSIRCA